LTPAVLQGRDCTEKGVIQHAEVGGWGLALCRGLDSPARKQDPNEDSCGVVAGPGVAVAVVADAHYGRRSAELSVDGLLSAAMTEPPGADPVGWLRSHLVEVNRRALPGSSACALLVVIIQGEQLTWASIGDCRLYRLRDGRTGVLNPLTGSYLGDWEGIEYNHGDCTLHAGDRIILASDGLPECRYGTPTLSPRQVGEIAREGTPAQAAIALVAAALEHGGEDNIAVVLLAHG
jgi:hypothetical protein